MPSVIEYPAPDTCLLHLVRHGATPHNLLTPPRLQGAGVDQSLTELGREQAQRTAALLADRPIAGVYCSPLLRALETAEIIAARHALAATPCDCFREVHVGRWEGRTWREIQNEDPQAYELYRQDPIAHGYPDGETGRQLIDRVARGLEQLMQDHVGRELVVVRHSVVNRLYLGSLLGITPEQSHHTPQTNCGVSTVRHKRGVTKVLTLNATGHLM
ncbi:MAG: histidine phosphatase family protein [Planctomycetales bacterium]|nr:histidine phosphatase family protein [Planctomycetales bacterium]